MKNLDKSISEAKQRGWITYEELARVLPDDMLDAEDIDRLIAQLGDAGIKVVECAADFEDSTESVQTIAAIRLLPSRREKRREFRFLSPHLKRRYSECDSA